MTTYDRRAFMGMTAATVLAGPSSVRRLSQPRQEPERMAPGVAFPRQDPQVVADFVRLAHFDAAKVKEMLAAHPALAKSAIDWGFGDWEDALGAASHTGHADIAQLLLVNGARPTLFSAAMLGQLETVKAFIAMAPGSQSTYGPHSITLLAHAKAGGERARPVRDYLEQVGGADPQPAGAVTLTEADRKKYVGTYSFGAGGDETLIVANEKAGLSVTRPGLPFARPLVAVGDHEFTPLGAESVRIKFSLRDGGAAQLSVFDPEPMVTATRTG